MTARVETVTPDWAGEPCIVAATGPSLTKDVIQTCRMKRWLGGWRILAVNDAAKVFPLADAMYACDEAWWDHHGPTLEFAGERWSSHEDGEAAANDKTEAQAKYGLRLVLGRNNPKFSRDPSVIHYGLNSGFQAVNLAMHKGVSRIVLVGFNMQRVKNEAHYFGEHPGKLSRGTTYTNFCKAYEAACPPPVPVVNATPDTALRCFPIMTLEEALRDQT